jgi:predicted DNA-binding transcriptional regulator YafY
MLQQAEERHVRPIDRYKVIHDLLSSRKRPVPFAAIQEALQYTPRSTIWRDLAYMRDTLNAPIDWDREARGYRFGKPRPGPVYKSPVPWFSADELQALMTMQQVLSSLDRGGLLGPAIEPILSKISALVDEGGFSIKAVRRKIKFIHIGARRTDNRYFPLISSALLHEPPRVLWRLFGLS